MGGYDHYQVIDIPINYDDETLRIIKKQQREYTIDIFRRLSTGKTEEEKLALWSMLSSRGSQKLIYGEMPNAKRIEETGTVHESGCALCGICKESGYSAIGCAGICGSGQAEGNS